MCCRGSWQTGKQREVSYFLQEINTKIRYHSSVLQGVYINCGHLCRIAFSRFLKAPNGVCRFTRKIGPISMKACTTFCPSFSNLIF